MYPWTVAPGGGSGLGVDRLITRLRQHVAEVLRAQEELALLDIESVASIRFYSERARMLGEAAGHADGEAQQLAAAGNPRGAAYTAGLATIFRRGEAEARVLLGAAEVAFGAGAMAAAATQDAHAEQQEEEEEEEYGGGDEEGHSSDEEYTLQELL